MTPDSTPREALYIETGLLDTETTADSKRLSMKARLEHNKSQIMETMLNYPECKWAKNTKETMAQYNITNQELIGSKNQTKTTIKKCIQEGLKQRLINDAQGKSKMNHFLTGKQEWKVGTPAEYMMQLTRKQASTIFKARTRMIKVKDNYRNGHTNNMCRACKNNIETQEHVLNGCEKLHPNNQNKTSYEDIFSESPDTLRKISNQINKIMTELENQ